MFAKRYPGLIGGLVLISTGLVLAQGATDLVTQAQQAFVGKDWTKSAELYGELVRDRPFDGEAWFRLGFSRHHLKEYEAAIEAYRSAHQMGYAPPRTAYNIGCAYALLGQADPAFEWLGKSVDSGFIGSALLKNDPDLESLRQDERFEELLKKAEKMANPCLDDPRYEKFDFWVGDWEVHTAGGQRAGMSQVEKILDGCIIFENWTGTNGYSGKAFHFYDKTAEKWRQFWVDNRGAFLHFTGEFQEGSLRYLEVEGEADDSLNRGSFTPLGDGAIRQRGEQSTDGGKTWSTQYELIYRSKE